MVERQRGIDEMKVLGLDCRGVNRCRSSPPAAISPPPFPRTSMINSSCGRSLENPHDLVQEALDAA